MRRAKRALAAIFVGLFLATGLSSCLVLTRSSAKPRPTTTVVTKKKVIKKKAPKKVRKSRKNVYTY